MRVPLLVALILLAGCMPPHPPPPPPPPELGTPSGGAYSWRIAPETVDKFAGVYRSGNDTLRFFRTGDRFFWDNPPPSGPVSLTMVGPSTFVAPSGTTFIFTVPADGPGAMVQMVYAEGQVRVWNRTR